MKKLLLLADSADNSQSTIDNRHLDFIIIKIITSKKIFDIALMDYSSLINERLTNEN